MITRNFKNILSAMLARSSGNYGTLPIKGISGKTVYTNTGASTASFPFNTATTGFTLISSSGGVHVGTGDTPPTENDYILQSQITSGLSGSVVVSKQIENGMLYLVLDVTLTNTSSDSITIREIGYYQYHMYCTVQGESGVANNFPFLMERTVLESPVTIPAGDFATIRYKVGYSVD